ncbi:sugar transferase [Campylobacter curvus]|uniref:sugar transferase n=1 Tax=Campylobacter curvus TaxID=200 RepID=UPI0014706ECC|nr:sugar transferase [Campylobacter curvus]
MLILGNKYVFSERDKKQLSKKFKNFDIILYEKEDPKKIRKYIGKLLKNKKYSHLILNTSAKIDSKIIRYLTLIQFKTRQHNLKIITIEDFLESDLKKCYIPSEQNNLNFLAQIHPYNKIEYIIKRIVDFIGVILLAIINLPIKIYVKRKITEQSPGEILFKQPRVGKDIKIFICNKYRTMHLNSDFNPYTRKNDSRIFEFGNFMRKTRIDEIPQYKNIINGDMHLVGPRAEWDILVRNYEKSIPYYNERHLVAPGITGWAQVNYPYGENEYDARQKLMYDLYYIKHWSLWLEIKIIFKTIIIVITKKGI